MCHLPHTIPTHLLLILRSIERIGDHAKQLAIPSFHLLVKLRFGDDILDSPLSRTKKSPQVFLRGTTLSQRMKRGSFKAPVPPVSPRNPAEQRSLAW